MSFETLVDKQGRPLAQIWPAVKQFQEVQDLLDRNRLLIAEITHNHQQSTQTSLERNVPMLQELNQNIARVLELYKHAADSFVESQKGRESKRGGDIKGEEASGAGSGAGTSTVLMQ